MLSPVDLESLITVKRREIEKEKMLLGLPVTTVDVNTENDKERCKRSEPRKVNFEDTVCENNDAKTENKKERGSDTPRQERDRDSHHQERDRDISHRESEERIPPELERYIRRYLGLPVMLKAGEYSPNNPLIRAERNSGDVLLGLGEYERRRNTLRKLRQQQYREYLDQQAKKKQELKEQAERERREREQREREQEEKERERELLERERTSPGRRRPSVSYAYNGGYCSNKVDTGVQVDSVTSPLSVAVQTDEADFYQLPPSPSKSLLTQAERELSPRTVVDPHDEKRVQPAAWTLDKWPGHNITVAERRRSYGDFDERSSTITKRTNRDRLVSDLRHSYMPSIFDADAIQMRNLQAEKEAAERRQFYQQELKNQILEQQRIKEERKTREKMLEQAEMRRLEEQLRMLRAAQDREIDKHQDITAKIKDEAIEYTKKHTDLQKEIDFEQQSLRRVTTHPPLTQRTSHSDTQPSKLPFYYPRLKTTNDQPYSTNDKPYSTNDKPYSTNDKPYSTNDKPYSTNIPDNSIFSPNYDVDSYLRRNLNFKDNRYSNLRRGSVQNIDIESIGNKKNEKNIVLENAIVHDLKSRNKLKEIDPADDSLPIPVLRHSPIQGDKVENDFNNAIKMPLPALRNTPMCQGDNVEKDNLSDAMKIVDDKWKVPAVQKNILRSLPNEEGKNVSILTQLGSIRRQLQLEQLKLDKMNKEDDV